MPKLPLEMIDRFTLLFTSLLLQTPIAVTTSLLVLRLRPVYGGTAPQFLAAGWGVWALRAALTAYGYWLTKSGLPAWEFPRRLVTVAGLGAGYALLPLLSAGTRGLAGLPAPSRDARRWTLVALAGGLALGVLATDPAMPTEWRVRLTLSLIAAINAVTFGVLGLQLWRVPRDPMTLGRQLAAIGCLGYAAKQASNLVAFADRSAGSGLVVLLGENLALIVVSLGTLALLFERQRVATEAAASERASAERVALRATAQLGIAIDAIDEPVALADPTLRITRVNPAFERLMRLLGRPEPAPGALLPSLAADDARPRWAAKLERVLKGEAVALRHEVLLADGLHTFDVRITPVSEGAVVEGVLVALRDVTADEALRRELAAREAYYRSLIEQSSDLISVISLDGMTRYVSPSITRVLGWSPEALTGQPALDLVHPDDLPTMVSGFQMAQQDGTRRRTYTVRLRRTDGRYADVEMVTSVFTTADSERVLVANARDLSERRALEQELLQAQRLDSLGRLAGGVAHDFNNLLTGILAHTEFARDAADDPAVVREELAEVETTARRAADLTRQLLTFARRERIAPSVFDVNERLRSLGRLLGRVVGDGVRLETALAPGALGIRADAGQFEQAIVNLVVNARDAMPDGGTVAIRTERVASAELLGGAPAVRITVRDSGIGMDDDTRRRIFEPFYTTKQGGRGTGLGLASVYGTVTQAGGHIAVTSARGEGATFELLLPEYDGRIPTPPSVPVTPAESASSRAPVSVLVAEDDDMVRRVVVKLLSRQGYRVVEAVDGEDGLAQWRAAPESFDLVLTDVMMPRVNGRAMAREMVRERPLVRVAYMSGYDADAVAAVPDAPDGPLVPKPFSESQLLDGIARALHAPSR